MLGKVLFPPGVGVVDGVALADVGPGEDGDHVVIGEGEPRVLVAAVHHHGRGGEDARDGVPGTGGTQLETVGVEYSTETLNHLLMRLLSSDKFRQVSLRAIIHVKS